MVREDLITYAEDSQSLFKAVHEFLSQHSRYAAAAAIVQVSRGATTTTDLSGRKTRDASGRVIDMSVDWHACLYAFHTAHTNWKEASQVFESHVASSQAAHSDKHR